TRVRSWTRTEQHIEVEAPDGTQVSLNHLILHTPMLGVLEGTSKVARLLKLNNDEDYTDDDFDDEDEHDLESEEDDEGEDEEDEDDEDEDDLAERQLPSAPQTEISSTLSTNWKPLFTTIRVGSTTVTVPDIGAIHGQLCELMARTEVHQKMAQEALRILEPLAQRAMALNYESNPDKAALAALREEARALATEPLRRAIQAREAAIAELAHGQQISQRATGAARVKEKLDALTAAAIAARDASLEAERLLQALEDTARSQLGDDQRI
ncbi:MAG: hypothetical protein RMJ98_06490, partial [Myxococcales bacterium]|nr:hypothetical protein [Polyangiaceae bacterium]MDW8248933.1 hypothetical protein [Myxococcales bacterium]